jgi:hypothetical protein
VLADHKLIILDFIPKPPLPSLLLLLLHLSIELDDIAKSVALTKLMLLKPFEILAHTIIQGNLI